MSNQKRFIMSVLSVLVAGSLLAGCNSSDEQSTENVAPPVRPVKTVIANAVTPSLERTYSAVLVPSQIAELSFRLNGRIIERGTHSSLVEQGGTYAGMWNRQKEYLPTDTSDRGTAQSFT